MTTGVHTHAFVFTTLVAFLLPCIAQAHGAAPKYTTEGAARRYAQSIALRRHTPSGAWVVVLNGAYCGTCVREAIEAYYESFIGDHHGSLLVVATPGNPTWTVSRESRKHRGIVLERETALCSLLARDQLGFAVHVVKGRGWEYRRLSDASDLRTSHPSALRNSAERSILRP
jgi:hypothetical protein